MSLTPCNPRTIQTTLTVLLGFVVFLLFIFNSTEENSIPRVTKHSLSPCGAGTRGCLLESSHDPLRPPRNGPPGRDCDFFNEYFQRALCVVETDTHLLVQELITPADVVLELGGRYGSTTCAVAVKQNNTGALIAVEPDPKVWAIHEFNKLAHNCASFSVFGVLGEKDLTVVENTGDTYAPGFTYNTKTAADPLAKGVQVGHFTWEKVEKVTGLKVDTVILDCEGCWIDFVRENLEKFRNVNKIILEHDHDDKEKTLEGFRLLGSVGLTQDKRSTGRIDLIPSMFIFTRGEKKK